MKKYKNEMDQRTYEDIKDKFAKTFDPKLDKLIEVVSIQATEAYLNAAYGGSHNDGGSSGYIDKLKAFLDGIQYAKTGQSNIYSKTFRELELEENSEYQKYLELKKKFDK